MEDFGLLNHGPALSHVTEKPPDENADGVAMGVNALLSATIVIA
jgi:hypothetical protein